MSEEAEAAVGEALGTVSVPVSRKATAFRSAGTRDLHARIQHRTFNQVVGYLYRFFIFQYVHHNIFCRQFLEVNGITESTPDD